MFASNSSKFLALLITASVLLLLSSSKQVSAAVVVDISVCKDNKCIDTDCKTTKVTEGQCSTVGTSEQARVQCQTKEYKKCFHGIAGYGSTKKCDVNSLNGWNVSLACGSCLSPIGSVSFNVTCDFEKNIVYFARVIPGFNKNLCDGVSQEKKVTPTGACTTVYTDYYFQRMSLDFYDCATAQVSTFGGSSCGPFGLNSFVEMPWIPTSCSEKVIIKNCPYPPVPNTTSTVTPLSTTSTTSSTTTTFTTQASVTASSTSTTAAHQQKTTTEEVTTTTTTTSPPQPTTTTGAGDVTGTSFPVPPNSNNNQCPQQPLTVNGKQANLQEIPGVLLNNLKSKTDGKYYSVSVSVCSASSPPPDTTACSFGNTFLQLYHGDLTCALGSMTKMSQDPKAFITPSGDGIVGLEYRNYAAGQVAYVNISCSASGGVVDLTAPDNYFSTSIEYDSNNQKWNRFDFNFASASICGATTFTSAPSTTSTTNSNNNNNNNGGNSGDDDGNRKKNKKEIIIIACAGGAALIILVGVVCYFLRSGKRNNTQFDPAFPDDKSLLQDPTPRGEHPGDDDHSAAGGGDGVQRSSNIEDEDEA